MAGIPALLVTLICAWFTVLVLRRYLFHRKRSHGFWALSLTASALASFAYCVTLWTGPHSIGWFKGYYILGAMWMPAIMGLGSLALVLSRRTVYIYSIVVMLFGIIGTILLIVEPYSDIALSHVDGGAGTGVITEGLWLVPLIVLNTFGAVSVVGVALWSAWKFVRKREMGVFFKGNVWLAIGVLVISSAGSAARLGAAQMFWIVMLIGWVLTFIGYQYLTPRIPRQG